MKSLSILLAPLGLALPLVAQTHPVTAATATDFGALATVNATTDFHSVDANTAVLPGLVVGARTGTNPMPGPGARTSRAEAHTNVSFMVPGPRPGPSSSLGLGALIQEAGIAASANAADAASSGTSGSNQNDPAPARGAHGLAVTFAVAANTTGTISLVWRGDATAGASAAVDVDVDGDSVIDFHGIADGTPVQQQFAVTAGANGIVVAVTTIGAADVTGIGVERYAGNLGVYFRGTVTQPTFTFTAFGASCAGTLAGQLATTPRGPSVQLDVTGGTPNALAFLLVGAPLQTPVNLPGGSCQILVENRLAGMTFLDANGDGTRMLGVPGRPPVDVNFQFLTLDFSGTTLGLGSTNGLNLLVQ